MFKSTVEPGVALTDNNGQPVDCSVSWDGYTTIILSPKSPLMEGTTYTLSWTNAGTDLSENNLVSDPEPVSYPVPGSISFTTIPNAPPEVIYLEPGGSSEIYILEPGGKYLVSNVDVMTAIVTDFSEPMDTSTINSNTFKLFKGGIDGTPVQGKFEYLKNNSRAVFRPDTDLDFNQNYTIQLTGDISDVSKQVGYLDALTATFTTASKPVIPHIEYYKPLAGVPTSLVNIGGYGFDADPANNKVTFTGLASGIDAQIIDATLTSLAVRVPFGAYSGYFRVTVNGIIDDQEAGKEWTYYYIIPDIDPCQLATANTITGSQSRDGEIDYDGGRAFITNPGDNTVSVIVNLNTDDPENYPPTTLDPIQVGTTPMKIAMNPLGTRVYVTNYNSRTVSVIDVEKDSPTEYQVIQTIDVGPYPNGIVVTGEKAYVANDQNVSVINVDLDKGGCDYVISNINTGTQNRDIDITADGGILVVTGNNGVNTIKLNQTEQGFNYVVTNANSGTETRDVSISADAGTAFVTTMTGDILLIDIVPGSESFGTAYGNYNPNVSAGDGQPSYDGLYYYVTNPDKNQVTVYELIYGGGGAGSSSPVLTLKESAIIPLPEGAICPEGLRIEQDNDKLIVINSGGTTNQGSVTLITICCDVDKSASDFIKDLIYPIQEMMIPEGGYLSKTLGNMLIGKLNDASINIFRNKTKTAINSMKSFVNKVKELKAAGKLHSDDADNLIRIAEYIICLLQNPDGKPPCELQP